MSAAPRPTAAPRVTAVVVSYRTRELTLECVRSFLRELGDLSAHLVVVDNASDDGSAEALRRHFPDLDLVALDENVGFGAACNLGAARARGEYVLMLNPDTVVVDGAVRELVAFADAHPGARLWGGRTTFADGSLNPASAWARPTPWSCLSTALGLASLFPRSDVLDPEGMGGWDRSTVREVDVVSGCFLLIDRALWEELGGFHPDFFMYGEDADLCLRARAAGARPLVDPRATIVHHGGASERVRADQMVRLFRGKAQLYRRFEPERRARRMLRCLDLWALHRATLFTLVSPLSRRAREKAAAWRAVWRRRAEWRDAFERTAPYGTTAAPADAGTREDGRREAG